MDNLKEKLQMLNKKLGTAEGRSFLINSIISISKSEYDNILDPLHYLVNYRNNFMRLVKELGAKQTQYSMNLTTIENSDDCSDEEKEIMFLELSLGFAQDYENLTRELYVISSKASDVIDVVHYNIISFITFIANKPKLINLLSDNDFDSPLNNDDKKENKDECEND